MVIRSTEKSTCGPKLHSAVQSAVHGMPSCSKDTTTSLQVSLKICDQKNKPNCLKTDKSDWAKTFFHFNLTIVLSGHMTILLKFYLRHQKWPKLAPNSPTMDRKSPEITWTSGISIPVRILPLLQKSGKLSVFRSYNPKFHNLEPKCGSQKSYNFLSHGPLLIPPYPPDAPQGSGGQKLPKCIPSSLMMIVNAKKPFRHIFFQLECTCSG